MAPTTASMIAPRTSSLIQRVASSLIYFVTGKGVMRVGKGKYYQFLPLLTLPLMMKDEKELQEQEEDIIKWIIWMQIFRPDSSFKQYQNYKAFQLWI